MQKKKRNYSISLAIAVFLLINTSYFWGKWIGVWAIPLTLLLVLLIVTLVIQLVLLFFLLVKNKFSDSYKNKEFGALLTIQVFTFFFPFGIIDFRKFEGKDIITAQREGVANCMLYLNIKEEGRFVEKEICFGAYERKGSYQIKGDTVLFHFEKDRTGIDKKALGIIVKNGNYEPLSKTMLYFKNQNDTIPLRLEVTKYDLSEK